MNIIILSIFVGVVGMGFGALITAFFGSRTDKMVSIFLSFAGGVMISIVLIELIPEAIKLSGVIIAIIGLAFGAIIVMLLNYIIDKISKTLRKGTDLHESYSEYFHSEGLSNKKQSLLKSGMIMLFAIALHNIPEGLALGAAEHHEYGLEFTLALMIGLHNLPEGMAVAAPLISGGMSKLKSIILVSLIGATTVIGTTLGYIIGGISDIILAISFAAAGGAMLYVVFGEILPQSIVANRDKIPTIFALVGIVIGILFTQI